MRKPHKHLVLDALVRTAPNDEQEAKEFLTSIITGIGMKVAELSNDQPNPIAWYCDDPDNRGLTASAILTTSHLVMHFWDTDQPAELHFDLYSCSDFNEQEILALLDEKFGLEEASGYLIDRQNNNNITRVEYDKDHG